ncbi:uncharacterized protein [Macrobrachium rosenbergii]|uniref:uncharacterized protein n=1 Tax=Macrobrachium rosenbergii TaxID=79674 RepID=UPI0034D6A43A
MRWSVFSLILCLLCRQSCSADVPTKESLCGLIVDTLYKDKCIQCFTDAGPLQENPEGFRFCVATYLPPLTAECAVPHPSIRKVARIDQHKPVVHPNHTNANLLPNCLNRRMRDLSRYLRSENRFTRQAGVIVKTVVESTLIPSGGMNMLNIMSQRYILCIPAVKDLVMFGAQSCLEGYDYTCESGRRSSVGGDSLESDEEEEEEEEGRSKILL